jgi:hypothetical protein
MNELEIYESDVASFVDYQVVRRAIDRIIPPSEKELHQICDLPHLTQRQELWEASTQDLSTRGS